MHATPSPIDFSQSTISEESKCYLDFEDQDEKAREIIFMQIFTILQLSPNKRRKKQLLELKEYFKNLDFFKKLAKPDDDDISFELARYRYLQAFNMSQGQKVFNYGDEGTWFYIIIKGSVGIKVPSIVTKKMTQKDLATFMDKNKEDILFKQCKHDLPIKSLKNGVPPNFLLDDQEIRTYEVCILKEVAELKDGMSFGEIALMQNQPRSATVYCKSQNAYFAVLDRKDFQKTYSTTQKILTKHKMDLMNHFGIFSHFGFKMLRKLSFYLFERKYCMNQNIYSENEFPDGVYLIENGEFELSKNVSDNNILRKFRVSRLGQNQIFGLHECINLTTRTMNATCISPTGTVYCIPSKDFVQKFLPKIPDEIVEAELIKIKDFLQLRYKSLVTLEKCSDLIKMDEIIRKYHNKRTQSHKKRKLNKAEVSQKPAGSKAKRKILAFERKVYNTSANERCASYFQRNYQRKDLSTKNSKETFNKNDLSVCLSSPKMATKDSVRESLGEKLRRELAASKQDDCTASKNNLMQQGALLKKSLKKETQEAKSNRFKVKVVNKLRQSRKVSLQKKIMGIQQKIGKKRNFYITLPKKKTKTNKIIGMNIKKIDIKPDIQKTEKSMQTTDFKFNKIKVLNKNLRQLKTPSKKSDKLSCPPQFIPTTNVFKSIDGKNKYAKTLYKVNSLEQYQKHVPEKLNRKEIHVTCINTLDVVAQQNCSFLNSDELICDMKRSNKTCNSTQNLPGKSLPTLNSFYFANIKVPLSLHKDFSDPSLTLPSYKEIQKFLSQETIFDEV
ncbi:unnamed protein product [Moneuplotes crassus]|uniref:Cyclic nucleotide-binding domain-containing protein n=1 Tax=Euplotes crassus TaxID=5936 RepID=A0AAD1XZZ5_EUPCR|nr:unnamed protein product [Moneuplotes crassus]